MRRSHPPSSFIADFGGEHRDKSALPKADCFMANLDAGLRQYVLHIPKREQKPNFGCPFEIDAPNSNWTFCQKLRLVER